MGNWFCGCILVESGCFCSDTEGGAESLGRLPLSVFFGVVVVELEVLLFRKNSTEVPLLAAPVTVCVV